jgi:RimJ/RimL family protein N-acetyltransferase
MHRIDFYPIHTSGMARNMSLYGDKLFTRRLALCKLEEENLATLVTWSQSDIACGTCLTPENYKLEQMRQQLQDGIFWSDQEKIFLVKTKEGDKAIGTAHYWHPVKGKKSVTMALKVAIPEERGKGYGTEIQKFLIIYLFDRLSTECIEMYTDVNNIPQQRCLKKLGFDLQESLTYDDLKVKRTGHLYRLTAEQYKAHSIYRYHYE